MDRRPRPVDAVPAELASPGPRPVQLSAAGFAVAFIGFALLAGGILAALFLSQAAMSGAEARARFTRDSVPAEGRVVELGRMRDGRRPVTFRYVADGRELYSGAFLHRREWRGLSAGSRIRVRYLPAHPSTVYMEGDGPDSVPLFAAPLTSLLLAFGAVLIGVSLRRQWKLLESGRPALARAISSTRSHHGRHRVKYEYTVSSGALRTASEEMTSPLAPGARFVVLYDRENQGRAARFPLSMVRLVRRES